MNSGQLLDLWSDALLTAAAVSAPFLFAALAVGLMASLFQAATQMQENILSFVPKLIAVGLVLMLGGGWLVDRVGGFTTRSFESIVTIGQAVGQ